MKKLVSANVIARELPEYFGSAAAVIRAGKARKIPMHVQSGGGTERVLRYRFRVDMVREAMEACWLSK